MGTEHPNYHDRFAEVAPRVRVSRFQFAAVAIALMAGLFAGRAEAFELNGRYATPGLGAIIAFELYDSEIMEPLFRFVERRLLPSGVFAGHDIDLYPQSVPGRILLSVIALLGLSVPLTGVTFAYLMSQALRVGSSRSLSLMCALVVVPMPPG